MSGLDRFTVDDGWLAVSPLIGHTAKDHFVEDSPADPVCLLLPGFSRLRPLQFRNPGEDELLVLLRRFAGLKQRLLQNFGQRGLSEAVRRIGNTNGDRNGQAESRSHVVHEFAVLRVSQH